MAKPSPRCRLRWRVDADQDRKGVNNSQLGHQGCCARQQVRPQTPIAPHGNWSSIHAMVQRPNWAKRRGQNGASLNTSTEVITALG